MKQPTWKLVANLGDVNPIEHGGLFVFEDTTGVYPPEIERFEPPLDACGKWEVRRAVCEPCTYVDGILSDNPHHPQASAWFADRVDSVAESCGMERDEFIRMITAGSVVERAEAWRMIGDYFGWDNLDSYPIELTRDEAIERVDR